MHRIAQSFESQGSKQGKQSQNRSLARSPKGVEADPQLMEEHLSSRGTEDQGGRLDPLEKKSGCRQDCWEGFGMLDQSDCNDRRN